MPLADTQIPAAPVIVLMAAGVITATYGHASRNQRTVALGLSMLFLATFLMVLLGYLAYQGDEVDPREPRNPAEEGR